MLGILRALGWPRLDSRNYSNIVFVYQLVLSNKTHSWSYTCVYLVQEASSCKIQLGFVKKKKMPQQVQLAVAEEMLQASMGPYPYGKRSMIPGGSDMRKV